MQPTKQKGDFFDSFVEVLKEIPGAASDAAGESFDALRGRGLANQKDRMEYVGKIAEKFHERMLTKRDEMEYELRKIIKRWENA